MRCRREANAACDTYTESRRSHGGCLPLGVCQLTSGLEMSTYILGMSLGGSLKMCLECLAINQKMSLAKLVRKEMCFGCLMSTFFSRKYVWNVSQRHFWLENVYLRHFLLKNVLMRHSKHISFPAHLTRDIFWPIERHSKHILSGPPKDIPSM